MILTAGNIGGQWTKTYDNNPMSYIIKKKKTKKQNYYLGCKVKTTLITNTKA